MTQPKTYHQWRITFNGSVSEPSPVNTPENAGQKLQKYASPGEAKRSWKSGLSPTSTFCKRWQVEPVDDLERTGNINLFCSCTDKSLSRYVKSAMPARPVMPEPCPPPLLHWGGDSPPHPNPGNSRNSRPKNREKEEPEIRLLFSEKRKEVFCIPQPPYPDANSNFFLSPHRQARSKRPTEHALKSDQPKKSDPIKVGLFLL